MTLVREEFNRQSIEFVKLCQQYGDSWNLLKKCENNQVRELRAEESAVCDTFDDELILSKSELRKCAKEDVVLGHEYNVIFSDSYQVPVMHFCVSDQAGCPLPVDQIVSIKSEDLSKVVSQVEHPLLFRPFYMIHPCRTSDFMQTHHSTSKSGYLISWLSVVATLVDLKLDHRLSLVCQR